MALGKLLEDSGSPPSYAGFSKFFPDVSTVNTDVQGT